MTKKYKIGSKSDMRRFERDLQKSLERSVASQVNNLSIDVKCPKCGHTGYLIHLFSYKVLLILNIFFLTSATELVDEVHLAFSSYLRRSRF